MNEQPVRNVAVIGLGQMGGGIARNLDRAGLLGAVWDPNPETMATYSERGNVAVAPPADLPADCRRLLFVVPGVAEITDCLTGPDAMLERMESGGIILDLTTSDPDASGELATTAAARDVDYLDCGMTGGAAGADAGYVQLFVWRFVPHGLEGGHLAHAGHGGSVGRRTDETASRDELALGRAHDPASIVEHTRPWV